MNKKPTFIFISDGYKGGASTFLFQHMEYLVKNNNRVLLIDKDPKITFPKINKKVKTYKININKNKNKNISLLKKINKFDKKKKYLIFTNFAILIRYFWYLKEFRNQENKIILIIHSGILELNLKRFLASLIFSIIYREVDYLFFGSNSAKLWWKNLFPWMKIKNSLIFYNGVKINNKNKPKKINKNIHISFAGRLEKENNPIFFINIAMEYLRKNKNVVFNIYGNGSLFNKLKSKYTSSKIIFHGWVNQNKIYKKTNLMIITSPVNNFPYVALEAKSYGIPVISCSRGDISKIISNGKDGFLRYTNSKKSMIDLIYKIEKNYKKFSNNSLIRSKFFEVNRSCEIFWESIDV